MKFLWSNCSSPAPTKTTIGETTVIVNNGRALKCIDSNGHSTHFRIENATGKIAAIASHKNYLACAELGKVAAIHLVDVHNTNSGRVNSIETLETFTLNNPNIEILDVALNVDLLLAVLFQDRVIIFQGKNPNGLIVECMNIPVSDPKKIMFDSVKKDQLYIWSDTMMSVLKLNISKKSADFEWQLLSENVDYSISDETGELEAKTEEKYLKEFSLSQDDFEANNSQLLVERAISQLDMIDGKPEALDKIIQVCSYNGNFVFVVTENSMLYLLNTKTKHVVNVFKQIKIKKQNTKQTQTWLNSICNYKPKDSEEILNFEEILNSSIMQVRSQNQKILIDYEYDGVVVEITNFTVNPETMAVTGFLNINQGCEGKSVEVFGRFRFLDNGSVSFRGNDAVENTVIVGQPSSFNNTSSIWITLSPTVTWIATTSTDQHSISFYDAENGDFLFDHHTEFRIRNIFCCSSVLLIGTACGTGLILNIEGVNQVKKCASYKLFDGELDLLHVNESKIVFGSSTSDKAFQFDTETQKFQKVLRTKAINERKLLFSHFELVGESVFYSARPVDYKTEHACMIGRIASKDVSQVMTNRAFRADFTVSSGLVKVKTKYSVCSIPVSKLIESRKINQKMVVDRIGKQHLPFMQMFNNEVLEPNNDFVWVSPKEAENNTFRTIECPTHLAITAGDSIVIYSNSGSGKFQSVKIKSSNVEIKVLLEDHLANVERENLEEKYHQERNVIQSRLDLLMNELKAAKDENSKLPDNEKIDNSEIVLNRQVIQQREVERIHAAERLQHELKMRIAIAKSREELIDKYCDASLKTRDGSIRYLNKSNQSFGKFYEIRLDTEQNQILEETESIRAVWKNKIIEELRVQASARTDQQNAELDEAEAAGGESTDDMMQRLATRGIGIGAGKDLFLPQLWLLDDDSRSDQEKLMILAAAAIRDHFNAKAKKLFDRKNAELSQHNDRVHRRQEIIDDFKVLPDVQKQVLPFLDTFAWAYSSEEQPNSLTQIAQEEIDVMLERANPGVFDIEQRKLQRSGKSGTEEKGDSDAKKQRTRALQDMMSGVLEIKEDIFSTDIPMPKFMDKFGDEYQEESDWSEEMKKTAKTYGKQCKLLEETRLKHKQQLLSEAKKLVDQDNASANSFDNALQDLCAAKSNSDAEQHSILLRAARLKLVSEHFRAVQMDILRVSEALECFSDIESRTELVSEQMQQLEQSLNQCKTKLDAIEHEDKALTNVFKKEFMAEFQVAGGNVDEANKAFKHAKLEKNIQLLDYLDEVACLTPLEIINYLVDRFSENSTENPLEESDVFHTRFQDILTQKYQLDVRKRVIECVQSYCTEQVSRLETAHANTESQIESIMKEQEKLAYNVSTNFIKNLPVQLLLKQGIVQLDGIDMCSGQEYSQCTLVERHEIESLNELILTKGNEKLDEMKKQIQFKQQIRLFQWELRRFQMIEEDLRQKMRDIQLFKLSKNVQQLIEGSGSNSGENGTGVKTAELEKQERIKLERHEQKLILQKKTAEKNFKRRLMNLKAENTEKTVENHELDQVIQAFAHTLAEKRLLDEVARDRAGQQARRKMQMIVKRRRLVEMARAQAQHLAVLHGELERMRMRTFPALTSLQEK